MKKLLLASAILMLSVSAAKADYTMVIPQKPGAGTSQWASIISKHLQKHLGEKIVLKHIPGARDIPGFNKFHKDLRFDEKTIMVSHGGNGVSFLTEKVDYNYLDYDPIGGMNLTIVMGHKGLKDKAIFAGGSGNVPDVMALTLYLCGNLTSLSAYKKWYEDKITFVKGMSGGERRMAYRRGDLNITRENPAAYKKHAQKAGEVLFTHGVTSAQGFKIVDDPNHPNKSFTKQFVEKWGEQPRGKLYGAYVLVKSYRDTLQKALWMNKNNPNTAKVRAALESMLNDPEAIKDIEKSVGKYDWWKGEELLDVVSKLDSMTTKKVLTTLVYWQKEVLGYNAVLKR